MNSFLRKRSRRPVTVLLCACLAMSGLLLSGCDESDGGWPQLEDPGRPVLGLTVSHQPEGDDHVNAGESLGLRVQVLNSGSVAAEAVEIGVTLPDILTFEAADPTAGTYDSVANIWDLAVLPPDSARVLTIAASVPENSVGEVLVFAASVLASVPADSTRGSHQDTLRVPVVNHPPDADDDAYVVLEGATLTVGAPGLLSNDLDFEGEAIVMDTLAVAMPFHGDVTLFGNGSFEYDHDGTEALADSFLYRIVDTSSESDTAMVRLDVVLVNDRPFITAPDSFTVAEGDTFPLVDLVPLGFDGDDDQETLTWQVFGGGELGVDLSADFVLEVAIPDEEWNGSEVLVLRLRDPLGAYSDAAVTFAVTPVNDTPVVSVLPSQVVSAGGSFLPIPLDSFVADVDHDDAEMVWTYRNHEPLQVEIDAGRNLTVTAPSVGWTGNVSMILRATDPEGAWAERPCHFVVSPAGK